MIKSGQIFAVMEIYILELGEQVREFLHVAGHQCDPDAVEFPEFILSAHLSSVDSFRSSASGSFDFAIDALWFCRRRISADGGGNHAQNK